MRPLGDSAGLLRHGTGSTRCAIRMRPLGLMGSASCYRAIGSRTGRCLGSGLAKLPLSISLSLRSSGVLLDLSSVLGRHTYLHDLYSSGKHGFSKLQSLWLLRTE